MQERKKAPFIPEILINNTKEKKEVDVDGVKQVVEIPAKEGFNVQERDDDGNYNKEFLTEKMEAVILLDRYELKSKYESSKFFFSNEFEFTPGKDNVRIYAPSTKEVLYEGDYAGAKEHFDTGQKNKVGKPITEFDVFAVLYVYYEGEIFRFKWKMNMNCNWFNYKANYERDLYHTHTTKFELSKKTAGTNEFWVCTLEQGTEVNKDDMQVQKNKVLKHFEDVKEMFQKREEPSTVDEISIDDIPF